VRANDDTFFVDFGVIKGHGARREAKSHRLPISVDQVDAIDSTHAHTDHAGRLGALLTDRCPQMASLSVTDGRSGGGRRRVEGDAILTRCDQHTDDVTLLAVMSEPRKRREGRREDLPSHRIAVKR
jgi:glyoxylase-like metal-dependent hydrolase (beta-lactamase superfamily II)